MNNNVLINKSNYFFLEDKDIINLKKIAYEHPLKDPEFVCILQMKTMYMK